jgi:hypothetical protein
MVTVTTQVPPPAAALQVAGDTEYGALSPLSVSVAAWLPLFVKVTLPLAAAAPLTALSAEAPFELTVTPLPLSVPDTGAAAAPVVAPVAVKVCAPCPPNAPPVVMVTVATQVPPPAATLQVVGATEYGALSPLSVSVAAWLPLLVKVTMPSAFAPPLLALNAEALFAVTAIALPLSVPDTAAVAGPVVPPVAVKVCAP